MCSESLAKDCYINKYNSNDIRNRRKTTTVFVIDVNNNNKISVELAIVTAG